jgi:hypothetical protein
MSDKNSFWDPKKPKEEKFATKDDIEKLQRDMERLLKDKDEPDTKGASSKLVKSLAKGFGDITKSLNEPDSKKRPKIARMQGCKPPIANTRVKNPIAGENAGMKKKKISYAP